MASSILFERYELKYWIPEHVTHAMAAWIAPFVELDPSCAEAPDRQYVITSIYLDSPRWSLYRDAAGDALDRFKLRVRTYGEMSDGPVTVEVKRKVKDVIVKSRAFVPRDLYPSCLVDASCRPSFRSAEEARYFDDFVRRMAERRVEPRLLVRYTREAYESVIDEYVRVTFDRKIHYQLAQGWDLFGDPRDWISLDGARENDLGPFASLEVKCESHFPQWLQEMAETFELRRGSYSKYVRAVSTERDLRYAGEEWDLEPVL